MANDAAVEHRPGTGARRAGYVIAAAVNAVLIHLVNVRPGWESMPFLTADARQVLGLVNLSLTAGLIFNLVYVLHDAPWLKSSGDLVTTGTGLVVTVRMLQVFPFDVRTPSFDWTFPVRLVLVLAMIGAAVGTVVQFVSLVRAISHGGRHACG